ncbi:MAG: hypothetical protein CHACPFDD_00714 [Phycisphaerae bacterium]|nr:hypothetical protein [Phycisphaerae bacterium]
MRAATDTQGAEELQLVCAEIWGGNRPVDTLVELPGVRGVLYSRPCGGGRGGDVHYVSVCGSGLLSRICIADVVGHGESVAAISHEMHATLRRCMNQPDQRRVLRDLNRRLVEIGFRAMTTAVAATYYPPAGSLSISYAGHPPGWLRSSASRGWAVLPPAEPRARDGRLANMALAVDAGVSFTRRDVRIAPGDRLLLVTDGVLEAPNPGQELFGAARVAALLDRAADAPIEVLASALRGELESFTQRGLEHDDVTFVLLEFVPGPRGPAVWHAVRNRVLRRRGNSQHFDRPGT